MRIKGTLWITTTAVLVALIIVLQAVTAPLGQLVTGSMVNLILITAVMLCGISSGLTVGAVSPVVAKLLGIGPLWSIIPFVIAGNAVIIIVWHLMSGIKFKNKHAVRCASVVVGAVCKFITLYAGIVKLAVPFLLNLPEQQAAVISNLFSVPQLFTALIGGGIAVAILPVLELAVKSRKDE